MWYALYEINRASLEPLRLAVRASARLWNHPLNPVAYTPFGKSCSMACDIIENVIGTYGPHGFDLIKLDEIRRTVTSRFRTDYGVLDAKILPFVRRRA